MHALTVPRTSSNYTLEMFSLTLEMFSLFIGVAIIGGVVGLFFLRAKRKPQARAKKATSGSDSRTSGRIADKGKGGAAAEAD